ncbi:hypothetical protein ANCCAN_16500, partial [Ancylostoma caninum]
MNAQMKTAAAILHNRTANKTEFLPFAAYDYSDYTMVTTTADGHYGYCLRKFSLLCCCNEEFVFGIPVVCRYFDNTFKELGPQISSVVFPDLAVHCCSRSNAAYMTVTLSPTEKVVKYIKVTNRRARAYKYNMSVCLSALYGSEPKWMYLVQLFEHYKLQDVTHFYVYIQEIDEYSHKLLLDYEDTGEAELIYFDREDRRPVRDWQFVAVQDCVGRSRHESEFVTLQDLDELFMPAGNKTLLEYAREKMTGPVASIAVHPYIVVRTSNPPAMYEGQGALLQHFPALIFTNSSGKTTKFRIKPMFIPEKVIAVLVHWIYLFEPGYVTYNSSMDEVFLLHYRDLLVDRFFEKYKDRLISFGPFTSRP